MHSNHICTEQRTGVYTHLSGGCQKDICLQTEYFINSSASILQTSLLRKSEKGNSVV